MGKSKRELQIEKEEKELQELIEKEMSGGASESQGEEEDTEQETVETKAEEETTEERTEKTETSIENTDNTDWKKRFGDLRRHSQKEKDAHEAEKRELNERIEALEKKETPSNVRPLAKDETVDDWMEKYPEVASIVSALAVKIAKEKVEEATEEFSTFKRKTEERDAESVILASHGDFLDLREDDDFHDWVENQSKWVKDALYENSTDPRSVIDVLDLYKLKTKKPEKKKDTSKEAAKAVDVKAKVAPKDKAQPKFSESMIKDNSDEWFQENEAEIFKSMQKGEFLYDITGNAR